jgi:hypothetical protein
MAARGHARLRWHAGAIALVALDIALVRKSLLRIHGHIRHVVASHVRVLRDARTTRLGREMLVRRLLRRVHLVAVYAILVAGSRLGSVEAGLENKPH